MATIDMTLENRPYLEALMRVVAASWPARDEDAEDLLVTAILEMLKLRKENEALRALAQAVVVDNGPLVQDRDYLSWQCGWCEYDDVRSDATDRASYGHTKDCPVTKARALLASTTEG
jgi:hypothetical protein